MHIFLRAIGFSKIETKSDEISLISSMAMSPALGGPERELHEHTYAEVKCEVGEGFGVIIHGYKNRQNGELEREYYFPYMEGLAATSMGGGYIRRHIDKEAYSVLCEEYRLGSALIFFLTNGIDYRERMDIDAPAELTSFSLTGMSVNGKILLPIQKTEKQIARIDANTKNRNRMMEAARSGDENAMESLTMEDIDLYGEISRRMMKEDIYSIVDSCFMPAGVECDSYMVIGEILQCDQMENYWTNEKVYRMLIRCNGLDITICINKEDLLGEPQVGRRFKGDIWLQGYGTFAE